jgi:hypothetical protein
MGSEAAPEATSAEGTEASLAEMAAAQAAMETLAANAL